MLNNHHQLGNWISPRAVTADGELVLGRQRQFTRMSHDVPSATLSIACSSALFLVRYQQVGIGAEFMVV